MKQNYRLGIDLGSTSLGWCMLELDQEGEPCSVLNMGVRIFPDGRDAKSKEPLSVARRSYRAQRRNLDRYLHRVRKLLEYFTIHGFISMEQAETDALFAINPYELRARALDSELSSGELARAIIHLAKRRGFRSNRKLLSDKKTAYSVAIENLKLNLQKSGSRSLGEYLFKEQAIFSGANEINRKPSKFRYEVNSDDPMPIFPTRDIVENEFDQIWDSQAKYNALYTELHKAAIKNIIFYQRPLMKQPVGKCQLLPLYQRAPKAHLLFQEFRIRQDLNNLRLISAFDNSTQDLSDAQYKTLYQMLSSKREVKFSTMRKELFGKRAGDYSFNLEANKREKLLGNLTRMEVLSHSESLWSLWESWSPEQQEKIIELLISDLDDQPLIIELESLGIDPQTSEQLMQLNLPGEYANISIEAMNRILPFMRDRHIYSKACEMAGISHSGEYNGIVYPDGDLPYYGELLKRETLELKRKSGDIDSDKHGKINNPTVHIALNQLRKLVNELCKKYGQPQQIVLEVGKEIKLSKAEKERINKINNQNKKINERIDEFLTNNAQSINRQNRLKVSLWMELSENELDRRCVYSGRQISATDLFTPKVEIDHILPKSRTYDDSSANKILCVNEANRYKGERSPFEAFGNSDNGYDWSGIVSRAQSLPDNKKKRFLKDAMARFDDQEEVLARMLNDTRYMSRIAMKYMYYICGSANVWVVTGRHTHMLRGKWGLNNALGNGEEKDRTDHRHHAIDAFVIGLTSRSLIKHLADSIRRSEDRFIENIEPPFSGFKYHDFQDKVDAIKVSYKPDHVKPSVLQKRGQTAGSLSKETAYGFVKLDEKDNNFAYFSERIKVTALKIKDIPRIASPDIRNALQSKFGHITEDKAFNQSIVHWAKEHNIKKIKLHFKAKLSTMVPIKDKEGNTYKYYQSGENLFADIYQKDPTDPLCSWDIEIVSSYEAHQKDFVPYWKKLYPKAKKIMRLYKNDIVAFTNSDGVRELRRVRKMSGNVVYLREITISTKPKNLQDIGEQFNPNTLYRLQACKAGIDIIGRYHDPYTGC